MGNESSRSVNSFDPGRTSANKMHKGATKVDGSIALGHAFLHAPQVSSRTYRGGVMGSPGNVTAVTVSPLFARPTTDDGPRGQVGAAGAAGTPSGGRGGQFDWSRPNIAGASSNNGGNRNRVAKGVTARLGGGSNTLGTKGTLKKLLGLPKRMTQSQQPAQSSTMKSFATMHMPTPVPKKDELINGVHKSIIELGGLDRLRDLLYCFYADNNFEKFVVGEVDVEEKVDHVAPLGLEYLNGKLKKKYNKTLDDLGIELAIAPGPTEGSDDNGSKSSLAEDRLAGIAGKVWSDGLRLELELFFLQHDPRVLREPQFNALLTYVEFCGAKKLDVRLLKVYGRALNMSGDDGTPTLPPSFLNSEFRETYRKILLHVLKEFYRDIDIGNKLGNKDVELNYIADWILKNGVPKLNTRLMVKYGQDLVNFLMETPFWERKRLVQIPAANMKHASTKSSLGIPSARLRSNSEGSGLPSTAGADVVEGVARQPEKAESRPRRNSCEPRLTKVEEQAAATAAAPSGSAKQHHRGKKKKQKGSRGNKHRGKPKREHRSAEEYSGFEVDDCIQDLRSDAALKQEIDLFLMRHDPMGILDGLDQYMYKYGQAYGREKLSSKLELKYGAGLSSFEGGDGSMLLGAKLTMTKGGKGPCAKQAKKDKKKYADMLGKSNLTAAELEFVKGWAELAHNDNIGTELSLDEV